MSWFNNFIDRSFFLNFFHTLAFDRTEAALDSQKNIIVSFIWISNIKLKWMCIEMTSSNFIWEIQQLCGKQKAELAKKEQTKFNKNSF